MNELLARIAQGAGVCGTCARLAEATSENEGYSSCCNDRIEYGDEAEQTVRRANCKHESTVIERGTAFGLNGHTERYATVVCADCGEYVAEASS